MQGKAINIFLLRGAEKDANYFGLHILY